jgi:hypothetical protein
MVNMRNPRPTNNEALGSVHSDELLPLRVFCARLGIGRKAWAVLARGGFPVIRCGKQGFIDGAAALAYFRGLGRETDKESVATPRRGAEKSGNSFAAVTGSVAIGANGRPKA